MAQKYDSILGQLEGMNLYNVFCHPHQLATEIVPQVYLRTRLPPQVKFNNQDTEFNPQIGHFDTLTREYQFTRFEFKVGKSKNVLEDILSRESCG